MADLREPTTEEVVAVAIVLHREHCEKFPLLQPAHRPSQPGIYPNQPDLWRWSYDCQREAVAVLKALAAEPTESLDARRLAEAMLRVREAQPGTLHFGSPMFNETPIHVANAIAKEYRALSQALRSEPSKGHDGPVHEEHVP